MKIYHNPRCSKSRAACELLDLKGIEVENIQYLKTPPNFDEIKEIVNKLGIEAKELIRFGEKITKDLNIKKSDNRSEDEWIQFMTDNPILIERPIFINGDKAVIGRPLENIETIL
jgi:arsenate reductase